ncbi:MAG: ABC transporter permease subunit [Candidatus Coatesbacteria bacterium]|nr:ABC transporter permease subunit [Candidatus Coatesbacteria bacterium]
MKIWAICLNTFRETVRDKVFILLVVFAIIMIIASRVFGFLSIGQEMKIVKDVGLGSISIFSLLVAIFVGTTLVHKEIDKRTIYTIVSKPIRRYQFIVGKYAGLNLTILVNVAMMSAFFYLSVKLMDGTWSFDLTMAILLIYIEVMVVTGFALLFSTFASPTLSAVFTFLIYLAGHLAKDLRFFGEQSMNIYLNVLSTGLYYILPNLTNFNTKNEAVHGFPIASTFYAYSIFYGLFYCAILVTVSSWIFKSKNLK